MIRRLMRASVLAVFGESPAAAQRMTGFVQRLDEAAKAWAR